MNDTIIINTKEVDRIAAALGTNVDGIIRRMAFQIEGEFKQRCAVDTHAMQNSCYTETSKDSGYEQATNSAQSNNGKVITTQHPKPEEGFANVGPCVNYAIYPEFGNSRQSAQPALVPAAEAVAQRYNSGKEWEELVK